MRTFIRIALITGAVLSQTASAKNFNAKPLSAGKILDQKLAQESGINSRLDLRIEVNRRLNRIVGLDDDTKQKVGTLLAQSYAKQQELEVQQLRLNSVLLKDMMGEMNAVEIELIKDRMLRLAEKSIDTAIADAREGHKILGTLADKHKEIFDDLFEPTLAFRP